MAKHQALQERVTGYPVGAMQSGAGGFTNGIQARNIRKSMQIGQYAAAGIVGRRYDRNRLLAEIKAETERLGINIREMLADKLRRLMADIQVYAIQAQA